MVLEVSGKKEAAAEISGGPFVSVTLVSLISFSGQHISHPSSTTIILDSFSPPRSHSTPSHSLEKLDFSLTENTRAVREVLLMW